MAENWEFGSGLSGYAWRAPNARANVLITHGFAEYAERYFSRYHLLAPKLNAPAPGDDTWTRVKRELAGLFVIRRETVPEISAEDRVQRAKLMLAAGRASDAVNEIPPLARVAFTYTCSVGVGCIPTSTTSHPVASSPHATACCNISPDMRVSRPSTTRPAPTNVPNACANEHASDGVRNSPTTPRIPDTPIFNRCSRI